MFTQIERTSAEDFDLPVAGVRYVKGARKNASKLVKASRGVSIVRYPSIKNGCVIQCASRTGEFPAFTGLEEDHDVTEYWDQPPKLKLKYTSKSGRTVGAWTTPDTCFYRNSTGWFIAEIKHRASMEQIAEKSPDRYVKDSSGQWICPPGIEAATELGMQYIMIIPDEKDDIQHRNFNWLEDYFLECVPENIEDQLRLVRNLVEQNDGRALLENLLPEVSDAALIYRAIAMNVVHFDKRRDLLCRPAQAWVYRDQATAIAWDHAHGISPLERSGIEFFEGNQFLWNDMPWTIRKVADNGCLLQSPKDEVLSMSGKQIVTLIESGDIEQIGVQIVDEEALTILRRARSEDLEQANNRLPLVQRFLRRDHTVTSEKPARTLRRWRKKYRKARERFGCGYLGLIPRNAAKGNRVDRLPKDTEDGIQESLKLDDRSIAAMGIYQAYALYTARCDEAGKEPVCYETYREYAVSVGVVERVESRSGKRASYRYKGPIGPVIIPVHGDRPWEVAHADHALSEIQLRSALTNEVLGRPWMSLLIDGNSDEPLARYYSFLSPSRVSLMMLLRDCVRRHNRLPQRIVVDQGADFNSIYFESTLAFYNSSKIERPSEDPKFGARGERINRTIDTKLLGVLLGNTKAAKNVRAMSASHDPVKHAVWRPKEYLQRFDEFLFELFPAMRSWGIHECPQSRFERLIKQAGTRPGRFIPYDEKFHIMTMLEPKKPTRRVHHFGVSINHIRYWAPELQDYVGDRRDYRVRFDPANISRAFIYLRNEWMELYATSPIVQEYVESGIDDGLVELMAHALKTSREYRSVPIAYARFLLACKRNEEFLSEQQALVYFDSQNDVAPFDDDVPDVFLPMNTQIFDIHNDSFGAM